MNRLVALLFLTTTTIFATNYSVDSGHSNVKFTIRHFVSKVSGEFRKFSGTINYDEKQPTKTAVDFSIDTASIDTGNEKRDNHLRSADFFDATTSPAITFKSKTVTAAGKNKLKVSGDLTIRKTTKPVTFEFEFLGTQKDFQGNQRAGFGATTTINRKDFGVEWNQTVDNKVVLGDDVNVDVQIEALPEAAPQKKTAQN